MTAVGKAHAVVHKRGVVRVQSSMRVGSRSVHTHHLMVEIQSC